MGKERKKKGRKNTSAVKKKGLSSSVNGDAPFEFDECENSGHREDFAAKEKEQKGKKNYSVEDLMKQVDECLDNFNFDLAVKFCERALDIEPDNVEVLETAGAVFLETGDTQKAKTCFENAVRISPEDGHSKYMNLGQLLEGQEAVAVYNKGIELMLANKDTGQGLEYPMERRQSCCPVRQEVAWTRPDLAILTPDYMNGDSFSAAASSSLTASPAEISTAYCSLAEMYLTDECFKDEAAAKCSECCQKAMEYDPTNPEAFQLMASCSLSQQNMDEARKMLEKSLELWQGKDEELPQAPVPSYETRIATSKLLIELENYETAGSVLEELVEESDEVPQVWYLLGWLYHITNQTSSSIRACLEKAEKLFTQFGCDDQPMMDHVTELLASLPEDAEECQEAENDDDEFVDDLNSVSSDEEEMDTQ